MTLRAWRIVQAHLAGHAFSGEGARLYGGRWNHPGSAVVYTAATKSLALLELLVHISAQQLLRSYVCIPVEFDNAMVKQLNAADLPKGWRSYPASNVTRDIGTAWVASGVSVVLAVPSVIVPEEWNYILNPAHPEFSKVLVGRAQVIEIDARLRKP